MQAAINPSIAFSLINSHEELRWNWHREMKGSFLIPPLLSFHSPRVISFSLPGDVFGCEQQSWEQHQHPFIHIITHIYHCCHRHTELSLQSPVHKMTLWPLGSAAMWLQKRRDAKTRRTVVVKVTCCNFAEEKDYFCQKMTIQEVISTNKYTHWPLY